MNLQEKFRALRCTWFADSFDPTPFLREHRVHWRRRYHDLSWDYEIRGRAPTCL